ncbi:VOC family protein [Halegenticoccus tardaugens]|uniref:VOC family protein n=1 Tax=Halegenticoccus tardaugens TaxID=2071624 RepID=UPI00100BCEB5|nr:VOC family protein [Halegenticoccus tardaugens]
MVPEIPALDVEIPEISQVAFVVEDAGDAMDRFGAVLGVDVWHLYRFEPPRLADTTLRGEPHDYSMLLALADVGGTMFELIEPLSGESIYTEHLETHGEGLHHIACFAFDDPEGVVTAFEEAGISVLQSGVFVETPYWYFDTQEHLNGVIFETAANVDALPEPDDTHTVSS